MKHILLFSVFVVSSLILSCSKQKSDSEQVSPQENVGSEVNSKDSSNNDNLALLRESIQSFARASSTEERERLADRIAEYAKRAHPLPDSIASIFPDVLNLTGSKVINTLVSKGGDNAWTMNPIVETLIEVVENVVVNLSNDDLLFLGMPGCEGQNIWVSLDPSNSPKHSCESMDQLGSCMEQQCPAGTKAVWKSCRDNQGMLGCPSNKNVVSCKNADGTSGKRDIQKIFCEPTNGGFIPEVEAEDVDGAQDGETSNENNSNPSGPNNQNI